MVVNSLFDTLLKKSRDFTKEEAKLYEGPIDKLFKPTGKIYFKEKEEEE